MKVKRTERGWAGHFICADRCLFRRNTLLELGRKRIVVSTVGGMRGSSDGKIDSIGYNRYYETMAFTAMKKGPYWEIDVSKRRTFDCEWAICADEAGLLPEGVDNDANAMHELVVAEFVRKMESA